MFKQKFAQKTKKQRILTVLCASVLIFLTLALVLGILNALFADGEWTLWSSYRYDETGYRIGSATVPSEQVNAIDLDWIDGSVEVVICSDALLSITEEVQGELAENAKLRWSVSADGTAFSVKYRKSAAFLGFGGGGDDKKLTVRIPERMLDQISSLKVNSKSASVKLEGVCADALQITTASGEVSVVGGTYQTVSVTTKTGNVSMDTCATDMVTLSSRRGNLTLSNAALAATLTLSSEEGSVELSLPEEAGFSLTVSCERDRFVCDRTLTSTETGYSYGNGTARIALSSEDGAVRLYTRK